MLFIKNNQVEDINRSVDFYKNEEIFLQDKTVYE